MFFVETGWDKKDKLDRCPVGLGWNDTWDFVNKIEALKSLCVCASVHAYPWVLQPILPPLD